MNDRDQIIGFAVEDAHRPVTAVGDEDLVRIGRIRDSLRLVEARDRVQALIGLEIEDLNGVVAKRRHEEPAPSDVNSEMINAPFDVWERDGGDLPKRNAVFLA